MKKLLASLNRRMDRGELAIKDTPWDKIGEAFLLVITSPLWIPLCVILLIMGSIAEWQDNCRDGVQTVKD